MRKTITLILSIVLIFSVMPMALSTSAEELKQTTLYSFEDESMDGITWPELSNSNKTISATRVSDIAQQGTYSLKLQNSTVYPTQYSAVNEDCFNQRVEFSIPSNIDVHGEVGFYMSMAQINSSQVYAYGVKTADGSYYLTHAHRFDRNADASSASDHKTVNTFYKINITGDKQQTNNMSRTYYKYGDDTVTKSFDYNNFASDATAEDKVESIVVIILTSARIDVSKNLDSYANVDNVYYETVDTPSETDGTTTSALSTDSKASIRLGDVCGIRFYSSIDEEAINGTVVEKGTLIGPADLVGDYLTIDDVDLTGETVKNAVAVPYKSDTLWAGNEFVGSIVGIKETNYNRAFTARAYVKLEDGTYLYSATYTTKTVADIADEYIADESSDYGTLTGEIKDLVDAWAAAND